VSVRKIPERTVVTCDRCGVECSNGLGPGRRRMNGRLIVKAHSLDMVGDPVADGSFERDFCDACMSLVLDALREALRDSDE